MHDVARDEHVLAVPAGPREADLVVVLAELRVAGLAATATVARDHALAHHAVAGGEVANALADLVDGAAPLVAGDDREAHPTRIGQDALDDVEIGAAHTRRVAAHEHVVRTGRGPLDLDIRHLVGALDDDCLHGADPIPSLQAASAG